MSNLEKKSKISKEIFKKESEEFKMSFKPVDPKVDFPKQEEEVLKFWEDNKIFEKSLSQQPQKAITIKFRRKGIYFLRWPTYGKRQATHWAYFNPCYKGYYSTLPNNERQKS